MKYLVNIIMADGEIRSDIFFNSLEEIEEYIAELQTDAVPYRKVVVYDAQTKEAEKIYKR